MTTALRNALPNACLVVLNIIVVSMLATQNQWTDLDKTTLMYYLLIGISCLAVVKACIPFNPLRIFLSVTTIIGIYVAAMLFHSILEIGFLNNSTIVIFLIMMVVNVLLRVLFFKIKKI